MTTQKVESVFPLSPMQQGMATRVNLPNSPPFVNFL